MCNITREKKGYLKEKQNQPTAPPPKETVDVSTANLYQYTH